MLRCYNLLEIKEKPETKTKKCSPSLKYLPAEEKPNFQVLKRINGKAKRYRHHKK